MVNINFKVPKNLFDSENYLLKMSNNLKKETEILTNKISNETKYIKGYSTGATKASLRSIYSKQTNIFKIEIGYHTPYSAFLEYGTRKMQAQPHLLPNVNSSETLMRLKKAVYEGLK